MGDGDDAKKDIKPQPAQQNTPANRGRRNWRRGGSSNNTQSNNGKFKGKTKDIEDDIFDMGGSHDAALFSRTLRAIADYIQLKYSNFDASEAVRKMTPATITIPPPPQPTVDDSGREIPVSDVAFYLWKREHSKAQDRKDAYDKDMKNAYTLVYHQCSHVLTTELEAAESFESIRSTQDVIALLGLIKSFCCSFDTKTQGVMATVKSIQRTFLFFQKDRVDNQTYHRKFIAHIETLDSYGGYGTIGVVPNQLKACLVKMQADGIISDPC